MSNVEIFTDGACRGNPGPGGWGALLRLGDHERELSGATAATTNNRMELTAAIEALRALRRRCVVNLWTDSEYLRRGISEWVASWQRRGWRTSDGKPVKNEDLWRALIEVVAQHQVQFHWVKGHSGHPENERADELANRAIDDMLEQAKESR